MREVLRLPPELGGWVWRYRFANDALRVHTHEELELNLVTSGTASYLVGDRRYDLRRGTVTWLFPGQGHVLLEPSAAFEMWIAVFRPALLRGACASPASRVLAHTAPVGRFSRSLQDDAAARLAALLAELTGAKDDPPRFDAGLAYALLTAWSAFSHADELPSAAELHPAVERAATLIRDDDGEAALSLVELAEHAGLSPSRLSRLFKGQTGVTLVRYRQQIHLQRFLKLYGSGQRTNMMAAALRSGFGSYPQFHRVFTQIIGCSPNEYRRRRNRGGAEYTG